METPSIWLGVTRYLAYGWDLESHPKDLESFGKKEGKGGILSPIPYVFVFDETPNNQLLLFLAHLIYIWIFERNKIHISVVLFVLFFFFCICKTLLWVSGITPIISDIRICRPSLGSEIGRRKGGTSCLTYLCNGTHSSLEWERQFQCYFTREDKYGNQPNRNFEFHWFGEKQEVERLLP